MKKGTIVKTGLIVGLMSAAALVQAAPTEGAGRSDIDESRDRNPARGKAHKQQMLKRYDADGDGVLSESERKQARADRAEGGGKGKGRKARRRAMMKRFDADGDGQLSESEREAARAAREARRSQQVEPEL